MSKSQLTKKYEKLLNSYLYRKVTYCNEVALHEHNNFFNNSYVDCLAYDMKKNFICFEIKVSKSDFHSKFGKNFYGNYNYYVMPRVLYEEVKNEIPEYIGCYVEKENSKGEAILIEVKKAVYQELGRFDDVSLIVCLMRALHREATRNIKSKLANTIYKYKYKELFNYEK